MTILDHAKETPQEYHLEPIEDGRAAVRIAGACDPHAPYQQSDSTKQVYQGLCCGNELIPPGMRPPPIF